MNEIKLIEKILWWCWRHKILALLIAYSVYYFFIYKQ